MTTLTQIQTDLIQDIQNPFELEVEQALSGDCIIGKMLFVDKGAISSLAGNFHISHQYLCIGKDDNNEPVLLSISEDHDNVELVSLSKALEGAVTVNSVAIHSGHKDPNVQNAIRQKGKEVADKYVGTTAAHYRMSEEKYIKGFAISVGVAAITYLGHTVGMPENSEMFNFIKDTLVYPKIALQAAGAMYLLNFGTNLAKFGVTSTASYISHWLADHQGLSKLATSLLKKVSTPGLKSTLEKMKDYWGIGKPATSLKEHLYTDKFHNIKSRITMGDAVLQILETVNPITARELKTYTEKNSIRNLSPAALMQFFKHSEHVGDLKTFEKRDSMWVNATRAIGDVVSVVGNASYQINNSRLSPSTLVMGFKGLVKRKTEKHAKFTNQNLMFWNKENTLSIVVNDNDGSPFVQILDSKNGELKRVLDTEETKRVFDLVDLESIPAVTRKLKAAKIIREDQEVNVELDQWENPLPRP